MGDESVLIYSLVFVPILNQFWVHFGAFRDPKSIKNWLSSLIRWTTIIDPIVFLTGYCSKTDFWSILETPRRLPGGSRRLKTAPKRCQDASKTAQDDFRHFQDGFRRSPLLARNVSQFTTHNEQIRVHKWKLTDHHLKCYILDRSQFWIHTS